MTQPEFSVHLGGGLYMDSNGVLSHGAEPGKPVYATPGGGFPIPLDAVAKAFQGLAKALPNEDDPESRKKFDKIFDGIGMAAADKENLIGILQGACAVASVIGSVVPIVGAALAVLTVVLELFKQGPTALELLITHRFDDLERQIKALEVQIQQRDLRSQRNAIAAALAAIANYVEELKNTSPDEATLRVRHQDLKPHVARAGLAARNLLDTSAWFASFNVAEYQRVWLGMSHRLYTFPTGAAPRRALLPAQGTNVFDHRLMVPLTMYAVTAYLTLLRALAPEFRSTRQHRDDLWDLAGLLETLVENMRREGLARTVYTAADFKDGAGGGVPWGFGPEEVIDFHMFGVPPCLAPGNTRFAVGALDLRAHQDAYFTPQFAAGPFQFPGAQNAKQGLLDVRWIPPAKLEKYQEPVPSLGWEPPNQAPPTRSRYRITNADECAQAANAIAEQNYVDLLFSSGYLNLVHLVATLRNEATDPDHSQTVRSEAWLRRKAGPSESVTVNSQPVRFTGEVISAAAQRAPYQYRATTSFTTQPLGRDHKLSYRVWLRTLNASFSLPGGSWISEQEYATYHQVGYVPDPQRPAFQKLFTSTGIALDELKLAEGMSAIEVRETSGTAVLNAVTFDWWIPVKSYGRRELRADAVVKDAGLRGVGWEPAGDAGAPPVVPAGTAGPSFPSAHPATITSAAGLMEGLHVSDLIGWEDSVEPAKGHRRLAASSEIEIDYTLRWEADRMTISLANNRAADRNYVVYAVVEELLGSGLVLHTVERIPVTGQLTFVPQSYFDEEFEANVRTARFFRDFAVHYAKSLPAIPRPHGPGDPDVTFGRGDEWLGVDRQLVTSDPVLRELQRTNFTVHEDFHRLAEVVLSHPPAARVLHQTLAGSNLSLTDLRGLLESAGERGRTLVE
jgi:hypothetical protein